MMDVPPIIPREFFPFLEPCKTTPIYVNNADQNVLVETLRFIMYLCCLYADVCLQDAKILDTCVQHMDLARAQAYFMNKNIERVVHDVASTLMIGPFSLCINVCFRAETLFFSDPCINKYTEKLVEKNNTQLPGLYALTSGLDTVLIPCSENQSKSWLSGRCRVKAVVDLYSGRRYNRSLLYSPQSVHLQGGGVVLCLPRCVNLRSVDYGVAGRFLAFLAGHVNCINEAYYALKFSSSFQNTDKIKTAACHLTGRSPDTPPLTCCSWTIFDRECSSTLSADFFRNSELFIWHLIPTTFSHHYLDRLKNSSVGNLRVAFLESQEGVTRLSRRDEILALLHAVHVLGPYASQCFEKKETVCFLKQSMKCSGGSFLKNTKTYLFDSSELNDRYIACQQCRTQVRSLTKENIFVIFNKACFKFIFRLVSFSGEHQHVRDSSPLLRLCCRESSIEAFMKAPHFLQLLTRAATKGTTPPAAKDALAHPDLSYTIVPSNTHFVRCNGVCSNKVAEFRMSRDSFSFRGNHGKRFIQFIIKLIDPKCTITNFIRKHPFSEKVIYNINYRGSDIDSLLISRQLIDYKNVLSKELPTPGSSFNICNINTTAHMHGVDNSDAVFTRFRQNECLFKEMIRFHGIEMREDDPIYPFSVFLFKRLSMCIPGASSSDIPTLLKRTVEKAVFTYGAKVNLDKNYIFCQRELETRTFIDKRERLLLEIVYELGRLCLPQQELPALVSLLAHLPFEVYVNTNAVQTLGTFRYKTRGDDDPGIILFRDWETELVVSSWKAWLRRCLFPQPTMR